MNKMLLIHNRIACGCLFLGITANLIVPAYANAQVEAEAHSQIDNHLLKTEPISTSEATLQTAEFNYRARRLSAAMEQFGMIAAMQDHPFAWLRVGNICHRRGDASGALDAYQRAAKSASRSSEYAELGHRAIMNQALLGLDQAQLALESLGMKSTGVADNLWVDEIQLRLEELSAAIPDIAVKDANR